MDIAYLEFVTPQVDAVCAVLQQVHRVSFGGPVPELGNARTADLASGGKIGVRAPLRPDELPVVRPYLLVDDLAARVDAARAAGAEIAIEAMKIPGHGTIAIYLLGGVEHGLWQR
ncbi:MAG: hydroxylase [Deltaproteobacteria bacterium]|nr:MAG: hydroxylase [Deltaproteobacteria bacterium]